jgi:hypothetical protein
MFAGELKGLLEKMTQFHMKGEELWMDRFE